VLPDLGPLNPVARTTGASGPRRRGLTPSTTRSDVIGTSTARSERRSLIPPGMAMNRPFLPAVHRPHQVGQAIQVWHGRSPRPAPPVGACRSAHGRTNVFVWPHRAVRRPASLPERRTRSASRTEPTTSSIDASSAATHLVRPRGFWPPVSFASGLPAPFASSAIKTPTSPRVEAR